MNSYLMHTSVFATILRYMLVILITGEKTKAHGIALICP